VFVLTLKILRIAMVFIVMIRCQPIKLHEKENAHEITSAISI
jgi:hypothetical protein